MPHHSGNVLTKSFTIIKIYCPPETIGGLRGIVDCGQGEPRLNITTDRENNNNNAVCASQSWIQNNKSQFQVFRSYYFLPHLSVIFYRKLPLGNIYQNLQSLDEYSVYLRVVLYIYTTMSYQIDIAPLVNQSDNNIKSDNRMNRKWVIFESET